MLETLRFYGEQWMNRIEQTKSLDSNSSKLYDFDYLRVNSNPKYGDYCPSPDSVDRYGMYIDQKISKQIISRDISTSVAHGIQLGKLCLYYELNREEKPFHELSVND